ncbi:MAG: AraC family transcriptional regulator [Cyclobacteriaceae bacterium]|nr:AraC family transcriptional regulator [Cyclobacteriaceae bacterium]
MGTSLVNILSTIIIFQLLLLALFLFSSSKGKKISNRILAVFFLWLAINLSDGLLSYHGLYEQYPQFALVEDGFAFLLGPLLFFYTRSMVYSDFRLKVLHLLHLIPFLIVTLALQIYYHRQTAEYQKFIQQAIAEQNLPPGFYFSIALVFAHISIYIFLSFQEIRVYRRRIRNQFSAVEKINLDWLVFMMMSVVVILVVSFAQTFLPVVGLKDFFQSLFIVPFLFLFFFTNAVVWKGLKQPEIFLGIAFAQQDEKKYQGTALSSHESGMIRERLAELMERDKIYLDAELSLDQLADRAGISSKKLSQVINASFDQNFFDFINRYRIEEAMHILRESTDAKLTVLEVMYQCGFNSKSSFNTLFKKITGKTPTEFRKSTDIR